jgi:hypothetical protein
VISSHGLDVSRTTGWITAREALTPASGVEDLQTLISPHSKFVPSHQALGWSRLCSMCFHNGVKLICVSLKF